jgi:hypothetical protein
MLKVEILFPFNKYGVKSEQHHPGVTPCDDVNRIRTRASLVCYWLLILLKSLKKEEKNFVLKV